MRLGVVLESDAARARDHRRDRIPGIALAVRDAVSGQHPRAVVALGALPEFVGEPGLAHASLADHQDEVGASASHGRGQGCGQHRQFVVATDERGQWTCSARTWGRDRARRVPRVDGLFASLDRERAERLVRDGSGGGCVRRGTDDHLPGLRDRLQPAGRVHDITHGGVVTARAQRAHQHLAGVDADAHADFGGSLGAEPFEVFLHPERGAHRSLGVVFVGDGRAEDRHQRIADHLVDLAAVGDDVGRESFEAEIHQILDVLRIGTLRESSEADEVGEQHRRHAAFVMARHDRVPTRRAEARVDRSVRTTGPARHRRIV